MVRQINRSYVSQSNLRTSLFAHITLTPGRSEAKKDYTYQEQLRDQVLKYFSRELMVIKFTCKSV